MAGETHSGTHDNLRPDQPTTPHDPELARQARQAENRSGSLEHGGELEPHDSRNVTGAGSAGVGTPGGADQQEGASRWGGGASAQEAAANQPDATTAAGQQPGIERREIQAEQQSRTSRSPGGMSPEAQHMAAAHVPPQHSGQQQAQQSQTLGQEGMSQSLGGMRQSFTAEQAAQAAQTQGVVDQQSASLGGAVPQAGSDVGGDRQVESVLGVGQDDQDAPGQQSQFAQAGGQQGGSGAAFDAVREHMEVVGADGVHLGTVDAIEGERIKLTRPDSGMGSHQGHHHYVSRGLVAAVEGNRVRLSATAANAYALEEER